MERSEVLDRIEESLGHRFSDRSILELALTHPSYAHERFQGSTGQNPAGKGLEHYERLEFLGDAVLGLVIADMVMAKFPLAEEGELSRVRAGLVCCERLAEVARELELGAGMKFGKGEQATGGEDKPSILADCYEAVVAAVYLDGGFERVKRVVAVHFQALVDSIPMVDLLGDYKTPLQEQIQAKFKTIPYYKVVAEEGPDHDKVFEVEVFINGECHGWGRGRSKKEAEQDAARRALTGRSEED